MTTDDKREPQPAVDYREPLHDMQQLPVASNARALLLEFAEWRDGAGWLYGEDAKVVDAFLAQHKGDLPSLPATVATSSQSGEEGQAGPGFYGASPAPVAPHVKVTEVVGRLSSDGTARHCLTDKPELQTDNGIMLDDLVSVEALPLPSVYDERQHQFTRHMSYDGPRGRFRVTCEFWPEEVTP